MSVHKLPVRDGVEALWERYASLVRQSHGDPSLQLDFKHQREIARAHKRFCDAVNALPDDAA